MNEFIANFAIRNDDGNELTFRIKSHTFETAIERIKDHYCTATCINIDLARYAVSGGYTADLETVPYLGE